MIYIAKKLMTLILLFITIIVLSACQKEEIEIIDNDDDGDIIIINGDENVIVSSIKESEDGKTYLDVMGNPYVIIGGQIRLDAMMNRGEGEHEAPSSAPKALTDIEIEQYFIEAKSFGINTLQIPIDWSWMELEKDVYNFEFLDLILSLSNKYEIKIEILWFSTNMCGDSHSFHLPDYIWNDIENYPRMEAEYNNQMLTEVWTHMYGYVGYLILDNPLLMERESKILGLMMDHIYEWNKDNNEMYPVISVQVHNESDGLTRWRVDQRKLTIDGQLIDYARAWEMTLIALDNAGKAIQNSKYIVVTRANMTVSFSVDGFPQFPEASPKDVLALDGIDIIGDDPYTEDPGKIKDTIFSYSLDGNYAHISENMGNYESTPSLILAAYAAGGFYNIYDFATPEYFIWINGGGAYQMDQGIINPDFTYKSHSELTKNIINGISLTGNIIATTPKENFAVFNVLSNLPEESITQIIQTLHAKITYSTETGALAFVIEVDGYLLVYGTDTFSIKVENMTLSPYAYIGEYNMFGEFTETNKVYPSGEYFDLLGQQLYVFKILSSEELLESTTMDNIR